jgi:Tol biopolymer transport system component
LTDDVRRPAEFPTSVPAVDRLDSWKEIGAYLKRDVTTVRRWEKREGLPVHRHLHDRRESVYAYRHEIDRWWDERRNHLTDKATAAPALPSGRRERLAWALTALLLAATLVLSGALAMRDLGESPPDGEQLRFLEFPPVEAHFATVALSPDGRRVAFTATRRGGRPMLWVRPLQSLTAVTLPGTEDATFPFWSPDGQSIGFFAHASLKRINASGGTPQIVCDAPDGRGGAWNANGTILFSPSRDSGLARVPETGGSPVPVTAVDRPRERGHVWPQFMPDGNHFIFLADSTQAEHHNLFAGALDTPDRKRLFNLASDAIYTPDGYLLFAGIDGKLMAQRFDAKRLEPAGEPVPIASEVLQQWQVDHKADFSASSNGILMFRGMRGLDTRLVWRDRVEGQSVLVATPFHYSEPTLSPDHTQIALSRFDPRPSTQFGIGVTKVTSDIWVTDAKSGAGSRFTFDPAADFAPVWSPDGTRIVFSSNRTGRVSLFEKNVNGVGGEQLLLGTPGSKHAQAWSPDGRFLAYVTYDQNTHEDIWLLPMLKSAENRTPVPLLRTEFTEEQVTISPDGRWFAYTSDESGRSEVYVQSFPSPGGKWQISTGGGGDARWRSDGRELYYIAEDRRLMAVAVKTGGSFERGAVTPLFDTGMQPYWAAARNHYDVSRDGQRLIFMSPVDDIRSSPFTVVVNWARAISPPAQR